MRQIDAVLLYSRREHSPAAAERYGRLIAASVRAIADNPLRPGSTEVPQARGVRVYPIRLSRHAVPQAYRVTSPRHVLLYQIATDGVIEILGVIHDRMNLPRAVRRALGMTE